MSEITIKLHTELVLMSELGSLFTPEAKALLRTAALKEHEAGEIHLTFKGKLHPRLKFADTATAEHYLETCLRLGAEGV